MRGRSQVARQAVKSQVHAASQPHPKPCQTGTGRTFDQSPVNRKTFEQPRDTRTVRIPKVYGQSKTNGCFFCGKTSTLVNEQSLPVCVTHKNAVLNDFKCACGNWLDLREGKWGPYWLCHDCGIINQRKALEFNQIQDVSKGRAVAPAQAALSQNDTTASSAVTYNVQKKSGAIAAKPTPASKRRATNESMAGYLSPDEFGE